METYVPDLTRWLNPRERRMSQACTSRREPGHRIDSDDVQLGGTDAVSLRTVDAYQQTARDQSSKLLGPPFMPRIYSASARAVTVASMVFIRSKIM